MGIINITPDSFFDGGNSTTKSAVLLKAEKMLTEGATFIDVGGYSSRPGATDISEKEELERVIPTIEAILKEFPEALISIDTFRSTIAKDAIEAGAAMVNDISAGKLDEAMFATVAKLKVPYIMMHMRGSPQTMSQHTDYQNITKEMLFYFSERIADARKAGISDVVADPGFGFAKTQQQNFTVLQQLELFKSLNIPILVGLSRKSMIYKTLETEAEFALNGTTSLHSIALLKGADILRVHDVKEAMECVKLIENLKN
jgi:dihydropteroate synthase